MISLNDYAQSGLSGFGHSSLQEAQELAKALTAGYDVNPATMTNGSALRVQSLENHLKLLTYNDRHIRFWKDIPKSPAFSTVEEYTQQEAFGNDSFGMFLREGELALANDSTYRRRTALVKYMGTTREVTHPVSLVHPMSGDIFELENRSGILWIMRQLEKALFEGDSSLAFDGESEEFDGLDNLIANDMFIDLEGSSVQEADWEDMTNLLSIYYAFPSDAYLGHYPLSDFVKTMYPRHRINLPPPEDGRVGQAINSMATQAGTLRLNATRFLERPATAPDAARGPAGYVPTAPASITVATNAGTAVGEFDKSQGTLDAKYAYIVTAANRFGESAPATAVLSATLTGAQAAAGWEIRPTITNSAAITVPPEYFNLYRTVALDSSTATAPTDETAYSLISRIPAESQSNGGTTPAVAGTLADINRIMPFTEKIYVGELSEQVLTVRQLAPMMKLDLAVLAPAYRWMILIYLVPILFAPRKWARMINVGRMI